MYPPEKGAIRGAWPYAISRVGWWRLSRMPALTPYLGVWLNFPEGLSNPHKRRTFEREHIEGLIGQLPPFVYFHQSLLPSVTDGLPFYWQGFQLQSRYTYEIAPASAADTVFRAFKGNVRNKLRKAREQLYCEESTELPLLYRLMEMSFRRQGLRPPFPFALLQQVDQALSECRCRRLYLARDSRGRPHAGIYLVWDQGRMYNLILGADPGLAQSGAVPFLLWRAIRDAIGLGLVFDFEGSMLRNVEQLFHSFGGVQRPYFSIFRGRNKLMEAAAFLLQKRI